MSFCGLVATEQTEFWLDDVAISGSVLNIYVSSSIEIISLVYSKERRKRKSEEKAKKKKFRAKHFNRQALFYDRNWIFLTWFQFVKNGITIENYFKDYFLMEITIPV